jgi:outer membrane protein assembly factor BamB
MFAIVLTLAAAAAAAEPGRDEWPQFRGPGCRGIAPDDPRLPDRWSLVKGEPGHENVRWFKPIPGRGWSSPIVWGNRVWLTTAVAADELDAPKRGLYFGGNRLETPDTTMRWLVICLDAASGEIIWEREVAEGKAPEAIHLKNSFASETPVTDGKHVWACFGNVGLFCLDAATGETVWKRDFEPRVTRFGWGPAASPALHDGRLYVVRDTEEASTLTAFESATGKTIWEVERDEKSNWSSPYVWQNRLRTEIITPGSDMSRAYDLAGKLLYEFSGASSITIATPYAVGDLLYVSSGYVIGRRKPLWAIRPGGAGDITLGEDETTSDAIAWSRPDIAPYNPSSLVYEGLLYVLTDRGIVSCFDATTGDEAYSRQRLPEGRAFTASPWAFNDRIFCGNEYGETFVVRAGREFEILHVNQLTEDDMIMASPAIAGGRLLLRTSRGLFCIAKP